jgi:hypothetical protein
LAILLNHLVGAASDPGGQTNLAALAQHLELQVVRPLGPRAWLARTAAGELVILKSGPGASAAALDFLRKLAMLHPPWAFPRPRLAVADSYVVYDVIPGTPLSAGDFEDLQVLRAVFELSGRLSALFRSLKLAPLMQGLSGQGVGSQPQGTRSQRLAALAAGLGHRQDSLAVRRLEASQSYAWAQELLTRCRDRWPAEDNHAAPAWPELEEKVANTTSIHLAVHGSGLAHTSFTPEHLLRLPDGTWGVVGWQVAPRPYNYMRYRYLAWCLVHTQQGDLAPRYRHFLEIMPAIQSSTAHPLTFVLALLETWIEAGGAVKLRQEKLQAMGQFLAAALAREP